MLQGEGGRSVRGCRDVGGRKRERECEGVGRCWRVKGEECKGGGEILEGAGDRGLGLECEWMGRCWRVGEGCGDHSDVTAGAEPGRDFI